MKTWLKGGLIVVGIYILLTLVLIPMESYWDKGEGFFITIWALPSFVGMLISSFIPLLHNSSSLLSSLLDLTILIITSLTFWFLIGSLIGLIIGKIKSKRQ
ncbi:MAG: hypothetical protein A2812_02270 [Candidatus Staskawiczbacteria bacterium RIFCSPHIGHO2_01_FULL_36_16]|uniref:Uncharacterized protein n=1 Tax=Candidatus Staskawiczbacteria bacterium RIFCSPHIGHO2_01_FULL_36_16 TaxID=1802200 RepID=A0A1G2HKR7_9BACT|nr:MAG: hypothetical protein A2812_02270 [Candidatus Staskawiczbacteria bacterium RIFCSPHIGHO2_01_FULL_36_16]